MSTVSNPSPERDPADLPSPPRPQAKRGLLIVNEHARSGAAPIDEAIEVMEEGGIALTRAECGAGLTVSDLIRRHQREIDLVVVGGGDGTLNAAAPALRETGLPLGILPLGTANDLARTLDIKPDPVEAAGVIAAGHLRAIDLGEVNGRPYFNVASIGFSAELARELTAEAKQRWGTLGYALAAAGLLRRMRPFRAEIAHDGVVERVRTIQISVGNGRHYGGGLTVESSAVPDDGHFNVYSLEIQHWWQLLALAPYLKRGTHGTWSEVRAIRTTALEVRTRRTMAINTDGEISTQTPATFRVLPGVVKVFAPRPSEDVPE